MRSPVPCIALLTDFGTRDPYVGIMKGVILSLNPAARIVDLSHESVAWSVMSGAFKLRSSVPFFPEGTLFVSVIDPGVGTRRKILYAESKRHRFLAPDNGLLSMLEPGDALRTIRSVTARRFMRAPISNTFHGRDIFAPVAGHLSLGLDPARLGPAVRPIRRVAWDTPGPLKDGSIEGRIIGSDRFGNLVTNIPGSSIRHPRTAVVSIVDDRIRGISRTYGGRKGALIALIGSAGLLEVSVVQGDAKARLAVDVGVPIDVFPAGIEARDSSVEDRVMLVETNLDNVSGESLGIAFERLFECGALDVWTTPIQMKKSRPAVKLSALVPIDQESRVVDGMLRHTPAFGVRSQVVHRYKLGRTIRRVPTKYGPIRVKLGTLDGETLRAAPEYEDVAAAARRAKVPFDAVHHAAAEAGRRLIR